MRRAARWGFWVLVVAHLLALYWPRVELPGTPPDGDKLGHALVFGLPTLAAVLALRRPWAGVAVVALLLHAPVSEWLQSAVLPLRRGDPGDALADLVGVALGASIARLWSGRLGRPAASR